MDETIYNSIISIQKGDKDVLLLMISKFRPLIHKLSKKMIYEDSETELIIFFIQLLKSIDLSKFNDFSEASLVKYIQIALNNKTIDCLKKYYSHKNEQAYSSIDMIDFDVNISIDIDTKLFVDELLNNTKLTQQQKTILNQYYFHDFSDSEIAKKLHISRQAVHKSRTHSLNALRKYLGINFIN